MPDVFDSIAPVKGDVFDSIAPDSGVQKMNATAPVALNPAPSLRAPSTLERLRHNPLVQAVLGPEIQPLVGGPKGVLPSIAQVAYGDERKPGLLNFSPAAVVNTPDTYIGGAVKGVLSQVNLQNLGLAKILGVLHGAEGLGANLLKVGAATGLASQGAQGLGQALGQRMSGTLSPEQKGGSDVDAATSLLMMLAPSAMNPTEAPKMDLNRLFDPTQNKYVSGEMQQGSPEMPFLQGGPGARFQVNAQGDVFDQITSGGQKAPEPLRSESVRPARAEPVVVGEQKQQQLNQGTQVLTPEMLGQSPTSVSPISAFTSYPVGDVGGQVSFRGQEGVPSAMQSKEIPAPPQNLTRQQIGQELNLRSHEWPQEIGGAQGYTDTKTGMSVEGIKPGTSGEVIEDRMQDKHEVPVEDSGVKERKAGGKVYGGLFFLDPDFWKDQVKVAGNVKMDATQLYNKIRNGLGKDSGAWKAADTEEFRRFMVGVGGVRRSVDEVREFMEKNGPKVEVMKFGQGSQTKEQIEFLNNMHWLDSQSPDIKKDFANFGYRNTELPEGYFDTLTSQKGKAFSDRFERTLELIKQPGIKESAGGTRQSHWQSIAPKSEIDMPGYTEIAVVKSTRTVGKTGTGQNVPLKEDVQFPSSHSFPPNTLGFARGYMETTPDGMKVFHVIEVQSDWAQKVRNDKEISSTISNPEPGSIVDQLNKHIDKQNDLLLPHYERLALKAAIDHARSQGADAIAISDAETAMMTEGHDRGLYTTGDETPEQAKENMLIKQAPGMRLHYDRTLPKIAEELTGEKGKSMEFGEHKMAFAQDEQEGVAFNEPRKDLIFRDPSGKPKTSVTARVYHIAKARENFSFFGSDKPKPSAIADVASEYKGDTKLHSGVPIFDPNLWGMSPEKVQELKDKYSKKILEAGSTVATDITQAARKSKLVSTPMTQAILNNPTARKWETLGKKFTQPGDTVKLSDAAHNAIAPIINKASEADKVLNPWDVIFDWMDGGKAEFKGPLVQQIRIPFDEKFQSEGNMQDLLTAPLKDIIKNSNLTPKNEQRIAVYLHSLQENGRQRMIDSGVRADVIDNIVRTLSPAERSYADAWRKIDDQLYPQLRDVALSADKVKVKQVSNHFPWMRDFDKYEPSPDEIATNPNLKSGSTVNPGEVLWPGLPLELGARKTPGSIISRQKGAKSPIRFDTFSIADRYIRDAAHYISSRELVKDTGKLVRSDEFAGKYGDLGQKLMTEFLNTYARQGRYKKNIWIDTIKRNLGRAIIGGRIPSQFLHTANIPLAIKQAGVEWWNKGLQESLSDKGQDFIKKHFIETTMRGGGEPVQAEIAAQQARTLVGKRFNDLSKWSFAVQRAIDQYNAQATTLGVYMKLLKSKGLDPSNYDTIPINPKLIGEARIRARRAVASPIYKDTPPIVARGGSLGRAFFQFQNVFLDQYSNLRYEAAQVGLPKTLRGSPKELMTTTAALLGMLMIETGIKHAYKQEVNKVSGQKQKDTDSFDKQLAEESLKRIPGMGQLQASILYGQSGVPVFDVPIDTVRQAKRLITGDKSERIIAGTKMATDLAEVGGVPGTSQAGDIVSAMERKQLFKTHEQKLQDQTGKAPSAMRLQDRVKAEREFKKTQTPLSKSDQAKAAERNISNIVKRGNEITQEMDKPTQQWIKGRGLGDALPGFDNKVKMGGENVYLTEDETKTLENYVKEEYTKTIGQLRTQKSTISKEVFNEQLTFARARARSRMINELSRSKNEQDNGNQSSKRGFSIIPKS